MTGEQKTGVFVDGRGGGGKPKGCDYGVATISSLLKIISLFGKRALSKRWYSAKETYKCKEPTNRSHPISWYVYTNAQHT